MRAEDSEGSDSEGTGETGGSLAPGVRPRSLRVSGGKRVRVEDAQADLSGFPRQACSSLPSVVGIPARPPLVPGPVPSDSSGDVIYVRTERVLLSQTFLTSWLVKKT
jgi:hypothetical protein